MPKATPATARMARMIVVVMRPLGFLESVDGAGVTGTGETGSTVVWLVSSGLFSFVVDAPSGAMGFSAPVLS